MNFDLDFTDGLVLAALLAAYCPYLVGLAENLFIYVEAHQYVRLRLGEPVIKLMVTLCSLIDVQPLQEDVHQDCQPGADSSQQHHRVPGLKYTWSQPRCTGKS